MSQYLLVAQVDRLPESANRIWRVGHGREYKAPKAREWQAYAAEIFRQHRLEEEPYAGEVYYQVDIYFKGRNRQDLDNRLKQIGDALISRPAKRKESEKLYAGIILDDSQIVKIIADKRKCGYGEKPHINITVWKYNKEGRETCDKIRAILEGSNTKTADNGRRG